MKFDIVLAGVGGQGILTIAYLLDNAAIRSGLRFKQSEVHGMAQRGGAVYSHMRISDSEVISDLIPEGRADMVLSVEPLEAQRYVHFLGEKGVVVSSDRPFVNIPDYPEAEEVIGALLKMSNAMLINSKKIAAASKSPRSENVAMVGAAIPFLPFEMEDFIPVLEELFGAKGQKIVDANKEVLERAYRIGMCYRQLLEMKIENSLLYSLTGKIEIASFNPKLVPEIGKALIENPEKARLAVDALDEDVEMSRSLIEKLG